MDRDEPVDPVSRLKELMAEEYERIAFNLSTWDRFWDLNRELEALIGKEWATLIRSQVVQEAE